MDVVRTQPRSLLTTSRHQCPLLCSIYVHGICCVPTGVAGFTWAHLPPWVEDHKASKVPSLRELRVVLPVARQRRAAHMHCRVFRHLARSR